jgi:hypothetical protein
MAGQTINTGLLDQDYAHRARSTNPRTGSMLPQQATEQSQPDSEYDTNMVDSLRQYISDSLRGVPGGQPELRGLHAKLPEPYEGEDNDHLERWLQGLLRYFRLHRLTSRDRDEDRVLVTGSCLRGQAERWFIHEVERPQRVARNWTFKSVVLGLYRTFVSTATTQQAAREYARIRFSYETGVHAFHRELLMWAGRLAQYPDSYSFKRRLLNGLSREYRNHLALYEGISAEHSSINVLCGRRDFTRRPWLPSDPDAGPTGTARTIAM